MQNTNRSSSLRNFRCLLMNDGMRYTPTTYQSTRKNVSLSTLHINSLPLTLSLMAIDDNNTMRITAIRSSTMSTASTCGANCRWRMLRSSRAFMMIVVDDIDSMPPRKRLLTKEKPISLPDR